MIGQSEYSKEDIVRTPRVEKLYLKVSIKLSNLKKRKRTGFSK